MRRQISGIFLSLALATACGTTGEGPGGGGALDSFGSADSSLLDAASGDGGDGQSADGGGTDHCSGAAAGDGTYCASSFSPIPSDAEAFSHVLFTCANHQVVKWASCAAACTAVSPGHDTCTVVPSCGDGTCNGHETCSNCPADCGACGPTCGDGSCNGTETCTTCAKDCGPCPVSDPCAGAYLGDGAYCGAALQPAASATDTLFTCKAKKTVTSEACAYGCNVASTGTADACKPPPVTGKLGKGVWVWKFDTEAPSAQQVAIDAQTMGIGFVLIKTGQDLSSYDTNFNAAIVQEFTSRGIEVYGWPYVTPGNNAAKAAVIAKAAKIPGVSGIILDVEVEFVGHDLDATELCDAIRQQAPGVFLGYTSFGWISKHLDFPYEAFDQACGDAFLPQTYWDLWPTSTTPTKTVTTAQTDAANLGLKAPIWAAQDNEQDPAVTGLKQFFTAAGPRASLWRWPNSDTDPQFAKMQQLNWAN